MSNAGQRRVFLAVRPVVVQGALVALLEAAELSEIVEHDGVAALADDSWFDVAVVTGKLPDAVRSTVVIVLPDTESGTGKATITTPHGTREVDVEFHRQVLDLLDEQFPSEAPLARWASPTPTPHCVAQHGASATVGPTGDRAP